jgi:hypothetical protein
MGTVEELKKKLIDFPTPEINDLLDTHIEDFYGLMNSKKYDPVMLTTYFLSFYAEMMVQETLRISDDDYELVNNGLHDFVERVFQQFMPEDDE